VSVDSPQGLLRQQHTTRGPCCRRQALALSPKPPSDTLKRSTDLRPIRKLARHGGATHLGHIQPRLRDGELVDGAGALRLPQRPLQLRKARPGRAPRRVPFHILLVQLPAPVAICVGVLYFFAKCMFETDVSRWRHLPGAKDELGAHLGASAVCCISTLFCVTQKATARGPAAMSLCKPNHGAIHGVRR